MVPAKTDERLDAEGIRVVRRRTRYSLETTPSECAESCSLGRSSSILNLVGKGDAIIVPGCITPGSALY